MALMLAKYIGIMFGTFSLAAILLWFGLEIYWKLKGGSPADKDEIVVITKYKNRRGY